MPKCDGACVCNCDRDPRDVTRPDGTIDPVPFAKDEKYHDLERRNTYGDMPAIYGRDFESGAVLGQEFRQEFATQGQGAGSVEDGVGDAGPGCPDRCDGTRCSDPCEMVAD